MSLNLRTMNLVFGERDYFRIGRDVMNLPTWQSEVIDHAWAGG